MRSRKSPEHGRTNPKTRANAAAVRCWSDTRLTMPNTIARKASGSVVNQFSQPRSGKNAKVAKIAAAMLNPQPKPPFHYLQSAPLLSYSAIFVPAGRVIPQPQYIVCASY